MKINRFKQTLLAASATMGLALLAGTAQASTTVLWTFDTAADVTSAWLSWWGGGTVTSDLTVGNPGGSMHISGNSATDQNMFVIAGWYPNANPDSSGHTWWTSNPVDLTTYTNVEFDIKWDKANSTAEISALNANGDPYSGVALWYMDSGNNAGNSIGTFPVPNAASNGWVHMNVPIPNTIGASAASSIGLAFKKYVGSAAFGTVAFWIDNIKLDKADVPTPPPTLSGPAKALSGLNLLAASGPYNRESIQTKSGLDESFLTGTPTYSFTIKKGVDGTAGAQFQNHIFLAPSPGTESSPDWNEANCIFMDLEATTSGGTSWTFRYKTNCPGANNMAYNNGPVTSVTVTAGGSGYSTAPTVVFTGVGSGAYATAQISDSGAVTNVIVNTNGTGYATAPAVSFVGGGGSGAAATANLNPYGMGSLVTLNESNITTGTWTLSVTGGNKFTMTTPSGQTTNVVLDPTVAALFPAPLTAYFGCQAGNAAGVGQLSVLSEIKITGTANPLDDVFVNESVLNTNIWVKNAVDATGINVIPGGQQWVYWTLPAVGYSLQSGSSLTTFADVTPSQQAQFGATYGALVPVVPGNQFYRTIKRVATQLQVLMPGQTNAPGTTLGYVGTATPISLAAQGLVTTTVTVNLCDAAWHIVSGTDSITLTTSDTAAALPGAVSMVNGTATFSDPNGILFETPGTSTTVTAQDGSNSSITNGTSAPFTVTN